MAERVVRVKLSAQVAEYEQEMLKAARATRTVGTESERLAQTRAAFEQVGRGLVVVGGALTAVTALSVKAAMDWESAWTGVEKVLDGTPTQFANLKQSLRDMTGELPASHQEIAAVAEAAGRLGIETDNIASFTRTMIDMGEATNISAETAATSLARFMNIMGTSPDLVNNLGSAVVDLGNNFATSESEIVEMAMRIAGAGAQIGLTEGEVMGLAAALSAVGIEAQAGGTSISKVMIDIAASVDAGGDRLEMFARTAGMSADDFAAKWRTAPGEALALFVKGLANAEAQGSSTLGVLAELGITEVRMRDALLRSASAADQFSGAMQRGNTAFDENIALQAEAERRYATTEARLAIARNAIRDAAIDFGEVFLPAVGAAADGVAGFAKFMGDLPDPVQGIIGVLVAATGGLALLGGTALLAVPKIAQFKIAMETLGITGGAARSALGRFVSFLGGPWGLAMLAATASTLAFNAAIDAGVPSHEEIKNAAQESASAIDMLRAAMQRGGFEQSLWGEYAAQLENLPGLLDRAAEAGWRWAELTFNEQGALDSVKRLGDALGEMARTNLPAATDAFSKLVDEFGLTQEQAIQLLREMPALRDELLSQATAAGVVADDQYLLEMALGRTSRATKTQASQLEELQGVANDTETDIRSLEDAIRKFGSATFDTESASLRFEDALRDLTSTLEKGEASLDKTTDAGSRTHRAMLDVAGSTNDYAGAVAAMGGSTEQVQGILERGRQKIIDTRMALGDSREAAEAYANQLVATPETVATQVHLNGVDEAAAKAENLRQVLDRISPVKQVSVRYQEIYDQRGPGWGVLDPFRSANGNLVDYQRAMVQAFANGGFPTGMYDGRAGGIHKFAEPETLWEAYISGKPDQRDRNVGIWMETGRRLGVLGDLITSLGQMGGASQPVVVNVYPSPGMSEEQIALVVARRLEFELRG